MLQSMFRSRTLHPTRIHCEITPPNRGVFCFCIHPCKYAHEQAHSCPCVVRNGNVHSSNTWHPHGHTRRFTSTEITMHTRLPRAVQTSNRTHVAFVPHLSEPLRGSISRRQLLQQPGSAAVGQVCQGFEHALGVHDVQQRRALHRLGLRLCQAPASRPQIRQDRSEACRRHGPSCPPCACARGVRSWRGCRRGRGSRGLRRAYTGGTALAVA